MAKWNEAEIDQIIASVEQTVKVVEAQALAKSAKGKQVSLNASAQGGKMAKDEKDGKPDPTADAATDSAPQADPSSADPAAQDTASAPAADAAPAPSESSPNGDPAAQGAPGQDQGGQPGEGQLEQPELSDEELHEIYGSMPHEELERHFMTIRSLLQDAYAQQDGSAGAAGAPAPQASAAPGAAPAPDAGMAPGMGKGEKEGKEVSMDKAEKAQLEALTKANTDLNKQVELLTKAVELGFTPKRKSIEGIDFIRKSELEAGGSQVTTLSKSEITDKCKALDYGKLSKADREAINAYMLDDDKNAKAHLEKLIAGGK